MHINDILLLPNFEAIKARFESYFEYRYGCKVWTGSIDTRGYGNFTIKGRNFIVSRLAYVFHHGSIDDGLCVCHSCDFKPCGHPDHLFAGTHQDNMDDMKAKERQSRLPGEDNGRAILMEDEVRRILADTRGTRTIAKDYKVSRSQIQRIKARKQWKTLIA